MVCQPVVAGKEVRKSFLQSALAVILLDILSIYDIFRMKIIVRYSERPGAMIRFWGIGWLTVQVASKYKPGHTMWVPRKSGGENAFTKI